MENVSNIGEFSFFLSELQRHPHEFFFLIDYVVFFIFLKRERAQKLRPARFCALRWTGMLIRSSSNDDGNGNENVTWKYNLFHLRYFAII